MIFSCTLSETLSIFAIFFSLIATFIQLVDLQRYADLPSLCLFGFAIISSGPIFVRRINPSLETWVRQEIHCLTRFCACGLIFFIPLFFLAQLQVELLQLFLFSFDPVFSFVVLLCFHFQKLSLLRQV